MRYEDMNIEDDHGVVHRPSYPNSNQEHMDKGNKRSFRYIRCMAYRDLQCRVVAEELTCVVCIAAK